MDATHHAILGLMRLCGLTLPLATALSSLIEPAEYYEAGAAISTASAAARTMLMVSGWASEIRLLPDGRRQIFSFVIPGDVVLSRSMAQSDLCTLVALTPVACAEVSQILARAEAGHREDLRQVMDRALSQSSRRRYDLLLRLSLRSPVARVADCLLELHDRLATVGLADSDGFEMPLTYEQIADASKTTPAQVRRSLRYLQARNLATLSHGRISGLDEPGLRTLQER